MVAVRPVEFRPDRSATEAHRALSRAVAIADQAQHCAVLWFADIMRRKLYRELGYSSINQYAARALGFSRSRTGDFIRLAGKLDELPALREAMADGRVGYTKAREVVKVATPQNEKAWVAEAERKSRRNLERTVVEVRRVRKKDPAQGELLEAGSARIDLAAAVPVRVGVDLTPEQHARWEALWERLAKLGGVPTGRRKGEAVLEALAMLVETKEADRQERTGSAPRGDISTPHFQLHVHRCPDCGAATVATARGDLPIDAADLARAECDAKVLIPGSRNTATIAPAVRRAVLARDRHRCQSPGCGSTRFLEVHHIKPRSTGGGNEPDNLITLCGACHRLAHERPEGWRAMLRGARTGVPGRA